MNAFIESPETIYRRAARLLDMETDRVGGDRDYAARQLSRKYGIDAGELIRSTQPSRQKKRPAYDFVARTRAAYADVLARWARALDSEARTQNAITGGPDLEIIECELATIQEQLEDIKAQAN